MCIWKVRMKHQTLPLFSTFLHDQAKCSALAIYLLVYCLPFILISSMTTSASASSNKNSHWVFNNIKIPAPCLVSDWHSGDNFEEFAESIDIKADYTKPYYHFRNNPGLYLGSKIQVGSTLDPGWGEKIILAPFLKDCLDGLISYGKVLSETTPDKTQCLVYDFLDCSYELKKKVPTEVCDSLAPNINGKCLSSNLVKTSTYSGGSKGYIQRIMIYGIFELAGAGETAIVPLKGFPSLEKGYGFIKKSSIK